MKQAKRKAAKKTRAKAKAKAKPLRAARRKRPPRKAAAPNRPASQLDARIAEVAGWRDASLARMRALIREADSAIAEEWKWSVPVWSRAGIVCTGESYKNVVKLTFARGAAVPDPTGLFNSSLQGNTRRAIDIREGEQVDAAAFKALVQAAVRVNVATKGA